MAIHIDEEACIGCGLCSAICPHNFILGDDAKAKVVSEELVDCTREAVDNCPTAAIKLNS